MTPEIQKYIELLESQLGYSEKSNSYTKFGAWYGKNVEFDADYSVAPWCDMYLSWAAHKLGYEDWIGQFAWTVEHAKWFKKQGAWGKKPEVGALVFYDWSGSDDIDRIDHVGVVTKVEGNRIHTIEGNIDGGVAKRKVRDTSKVVGYGYPQRVKERLERKAKKKAEKETPDALREAGKPGSEVGTLQSPEQSLSAYIPRADDGRSGQVPLSGDRIQSPQISGDEPNQVRGRTEGQTPEQAQAQPQGEPRTTTSSPPARARRLRPRSRRPRRRPPLVRTRPERAPHPPAPPRPRPARPRARPRGRPLGRASTPSRAPPTPRRPPASPFPPTATPRPPGRCPPSTPRRSSARR
ncbi:CHAP domain-containing protein [Nonomuraea fastidiosa]|uniref:CHAP domain-containing protein n=1 Tax=Nonomuraea fastidiosa TaxID=46173 RepID=UPI00366BFC69